MRRIDSNGRQELAIVVGVAEFGAGEILAAGVRILDMAKMVFAEAIRPRTMVAQAQ